MATSKNHKLCITRPSQNAHSPHASSAFASVKSLDFRVFRGCLILLLSLILVLSTGCARRNVTTGAPSKTQSSLGTNVARTATSQIGRPYRLGGSTPQSGFDCSGLVYWSYGQHGIKVPRTTTGQSRAGKSIPRSRLIPGDIVVFRERSGLHTGIYIGNNNFVHSPNSRSTVRTDSLDASHWRRIFISGRRIV